MPARLLVTFAQLPGGTELLPSSVELDPESFVGFTPESLVEFDPASFVPASVLVVASGMTQPALRGNDAIHAVRATPLHPGDLRAT
jgi:hypothetical protein